MVDEPAVVTGDNQRSFPATQRIFQCWRLCHKGGSVAFVVTGAAEKGGCWLDMLGVLLG